MSEPMHDPARPTPPPPPNYAAPPIPAPSSSLTDNLAAALAYITIIPAIIFLVLEPYNRIPLVRFHSFQSIGLCVAAFLLQVAMAFSGSFLHLIPLGWMILFALQMIVGVGLLIAWLVVIFKAWQGEFYKLPIIGDFAEKQVRG